MILITFSLENQASLISTLRTPGSHIQTRLRVAEGSKYMIQFHTHFSQDDLEKLAAHLQIHEVSEIMSRSTAAANENSKFLEIQRPELF
ncbi:MAG: hypothetical protein P8L66_10885 [Rhodospirillaceae bacterium]|nr:hypothetical protein [Rhodospirillaceae bacterium]